MPLSRMPNTERRKTSHSNTVPRSGVEPGRVVSAPPAAPRVREALEEVRAPGKEVVEPVEAPEAEGVPETAEEVVAAAAVVPEAAEEDNLQDLLFHYL